MKLKKFKQNNKQKRIIVVSIVVLLILVGGITLYRTYALYEEKKEFNVLKGKIPNFMKTDLSLAFVVDGVASEKVPARGNYLVEVICDGGQGEWDYTAWNIVIRSFSNGTKCDVTFTSVTEEEMPEIKTIKKLRKGYHITSLNPNRRTATCNFSEIPGYENLTIDNFEVYLQGSVSMSDHNGTFNSFANISSYDPTTGILNISYQYDSQTGRLRTSYMHLYCVAYYI